MYNVNSLVENLLKVEATDHRKIQEEIQENPLKNPGSSPATAGHYRVKNKIKNMAEVKVLNVEMFFGKRIFPKTILVLRTKKS